MEKESLTELTKFLDRIPAVSVLSSDMQDDSFWWVKLSIDIKSPLAWNVVQELGFVLNYLTIEESSPTLFMPVSPPPYLNGGPEEFLSWVIESRMENVDPAWIAKTLEGRLPRPVEDLKEWSEEEELEDEE